MLQSQQLPKGKQIGKKQVSPKPKREEVLAPCCRLRLPPGVLGGSAAALKVNHASRCRAAKEIRLVELSVGIIRIVSSLAGSRLTPTGSWRL